eukprot:jgi/Psemu1/310952/fgenesh1_kg.700_\
MAFFIFSNLVNARPITVYAVYCSTNMPTIRNLTIPQRPTHWHQFLGRVTGNPRAPGRHVAPLSFHAS